MGHHECYYCGMIFNTKESLYDHLEVHSKTIEEQKEEMETNNEKDKKGK